MQTKASVIVLVIIHLNEKNRRDRKAARTIKKEWTISFYRGNKCEITLKRTCKFKYTSGHHRLILSLA